MQKNVHIENNAKDISELRLEYERRLNEHLAAHKNNIYTLRKSLKLKRENRNIGN